jgi:hypothetical protein
MSYSLTAKQYVQARLDYIYGNANLPARQLIDSLRDQPPLGEGERKVAYPHGEDKVVAFLSPKWAPSDPSLYGDYLVHDPNSMKKRFYSKKILHALLPEYVPDIHMVGSRPGMEITDRVFSADPTKPVTILQSLKRHVSLKRMERKITKLGLEHDGYVDNIIYDDSDKAHYVDDLRYDSLVGIRKGIKRLDKADRARATRWLEKMLALEGGDNVPAWHNQQHQKDRNR